MKMRAYSNKQRGASLLEVMIALVVVSVGLLGVAAMQGIAIQNSQGSHHHTLASVIAYDALEQARLALDGRVISGGTVPAAVRDPIQTALAARYADRFPSNFSVVMVIQGGDIVVTVSWIDEALELDLGDDGDPDTTPDGDVGANAVRVRGRLL